MPFCPNCGAKVTGSFCGNCGTSLGQGDTGSVWSSPGGSAALEDHVAAALCYLFGFITGLIFLAWAPYNKSKNVRFHAFQSIFLTAAWFVIQLAFPIVMPIATWYYINQLLSLAAVVLWLFLMWKTYSKERIVLPVIGPLAEKQS